MANKKKVSSLQNQKRNTYIKIAVAVLAIAIIGGLVMGLSNATSRKYQASGLNSGCKSYPALKKGSTGACVKAVQTAINNYSDFMNFFHKKGYQKLVVDGKYGDKTVFAVAVYQKDVKIPANGTVDSKTWSKITDDCRTFRACNFGQGK